MSTIKPKGTEKGKLVRAFTLALLAGVSMTAMGCNAMHNIGESIDQGTEKLFYKATFQDKECGATTINKGNRSSSNGKISKGDGAQSVMKCIEPKAMEKQMQVQMDAMRVRAEAQQKLQFDLQKKRDEQSKELDLERIKWRTELAKFDECKRQELATLRGHVLSEPCKEILDAHDKNKSKTSPDGKQTPKP
jgi:hypothetical protein